MIRGFEMSGRFPVKITRGEDSFFVVECPVIPGCISQGRTKEEAIRNIREAIELCLEADTASLGELRNAEFEMVDLAHG